MHWIQLGCKHHPLYLPITESQGGLSIAQQPVLHSAVVYQVLPQLYMSTLQKLVSIVLAQLMNGVETHAVAWS